MDWLCWMVVGFGYFITYAYSQITALLSSVSVALLVTLLQDISTSALGIMWTLYEWLWPPARTLTRDDDVRPSRLG